MNYTHPFAGYNNQLGGYDNQLGQMPAFVGTLKSKIPGMTNVPDIAFAGGLVVGGLLLASFFIPALGKQRKKLLTY